MGEDPKTVVEDEEVYEQSTLQKLTNTILCRGDLAKQTFEARPVAFIELFRFSSRYDKFLVVSGVALALGVGIVMPLMFVISGRLTNVLIVETQYVGNNKFRSDMYYNVVLFAISGVVLSIISYLQYMCLHHAACDIVRNTRSEYMRSLLRQDAAWFDNQKAGALTAQLNENIDKIRDGIGDKLGFILRGMTMFGVCLIIAFIYDWRISLIMLLIVPVSVVLTSVSSRMIEVATGKQLTQNAENSAVLEESVMNFKTIASCNGQNSFITRYTSGLKIARKYAGKVAGILGVTEGLSFFAMYLFSGIGFYYGAYLLKIGLIDEPGDIFIVNNNLIFGAYFLSLLSPHLMSVTNARVAAAVIYRTIDRKPPVDSYDKEGVVMKESKGTVQFSNVHFSYPTRKDHKVFSGLTFNVNAGDTVALVGHSGCGKSTVVGLLTHLYECTVGEVSIDDIDVRNINIEALRNVVGVVQQEPVLFNGTINENVRLGRPDATDEEIVEYCTMANAHTFIKALPEGYNTVIGTGGIQLSGGQKQRIAIARTIARNPRILLLDEATSALDADSEITVQEALKKASEGRTTIMIAHRLSSLRDASNIIVINEGKVAEMGSHKELLKREDGIYANLVKSQQFDEENNDEFDEHVPQSPKLENAKVIMRAISERSSSSHFDRRISAASNLTSSIRRRSTMRSEKKVPVEDKDVKQPRFGLWYLYTHCNGFYVQLSLAVISSVLRGLEIPIAAFIFKQTFNAFVAPTPEAMMRKILYAGIMFTALGVYTLIFLGFAMFLFGWTAECIVDWLRKRALVNVLNQDASYFDEPARSTAMTVTRLSTDAPNMKGALDIGMVQIVNNAVALIGAYAMSLIYCWEVGLGGVGYIVVVFVIIVVAAKVRERFGDAAITKDFSGQLAIEIIEQTRTVQLLTRERDFCRRYDEKLDIALALNKRCGPPEAITFLFANSFSFFADMIAYGIGAHLMYHGQTTPDDVFAAAMAANWGGWALVMLSSSLTPLMAAPSAIDSIFRIVNAPKRQYNAPSGHKRRQLHGDLAFSKVKFAYPTRPQQSVLNGLTLDASTGQTIALVGPSGSGKSTVISILERFYDNTSGIVTLDNNELKAIPLDELREQIALVGQEPVLFSGTIQENVLLGVTGKTDEDVRRVCEMANARQFIEGMPKGYETEVGERGAQLSGGQKQRISIARALIRDPKILLLDEATSALDADSEKVVQQALDKASSGRTCVTVAHRLSTIQRADQIFFIENGIVIEHGTHQELMDANGKYADLIHKQDLKS